MLPRIWIGEVVFGRLLFFNGYLLIVLLVSIGPTRLTVIMLVINPWLRKPQQPAGKAQDTGDRNKGKKLMNNVDVQLKVASIA